MKKIKSKSPYNTPKSIIIGCIGTKCNMLKNCIVTKLHERTAAKSLHVGLVSFTHCYLQLVTSTTTC